tara:strand:- start:6657 stop:6800 length:144 start_codon:yes stop_codon:yes gene_type:complete
MILKGFLLICLDYLRGLIKNAAPKLKQQIVMTFFGGIQDITLLYYST